MNLAVDVHYDGDARAGAVSRLLGFGRKLVVSYRSAFGLTSVGWLALAHPDPLTSAAATAPDHAPCEPIP